MLSSCTPSGAAADPFLAALVHLFLPEGHLDLEDVDRVLARGERVLAVRGADRDHHRRLAELHTAYAVVDRDLVDLVALLEAVSELLHHRLGHPLVALVVEVLHDAAAGVAAGGAGEGGDR